MVLDWQACQNDIAVASALVQPVLAESKPEPEFLGDKPRLILFRRTSFETDYLLKGDDIGVEFA